MWFAMLPHTSPGAGVQASHLDLSTSHDTLLKNTYNKKKQSLD